MNHLLTCIAVLALAGCAPRIPLLVVAPGSDSAREPRPASEIMNDAAVTPRYGAGAIVVASRKKSRFAKGCTLDVALDDQQVAGLRPGEQVVVFAEPGRRVIDLRVRDEGTCERETARVAVDVVAHSTQQIEVDSHARNGVKAELAPYGRSLPP